MIITRIIGGLGNQMFQYAFGLAKSLNANSELKLDVSEFNNYFRKYALGDVYHLKEKFATEAELGLYKTQNKVIKLLRKTGLIPNNYFREDNYAFSPELYKNNSHGYYDGYWQSYKYFSAHEDKIREAFTFRNPLSEVSRQYLTQINETNSCSVHIRRGDYVSDKATNQTHGTCNLDYYQTAVKLMTDNDPETTFFIFSDDLEWARVHFEFIKKKSFIEGLNLSDWEELLLMSRCRHNIIANSSFSWWAAWLNNNQDKTVIAPRMWFNDVSINTTDLCPLGWKKI